MKAMRSKNMSDILNSCLETVREGWEKTLVKTLKWTLHASGRDAISELSRSELVFLMVVNSLANLNAEMSVILLKELDRWSVFPRITKYMSGKMEAEWNVPWEMLDRAAKFAIILERSGMFTVPQELHLYLAELLSRGVIGSGNEGEDAPSHEQSKRPRKDPRVGPSQQGDKSSISGQTSHRAPQQKSCKSLEIAGRMRSSNGPGDRGQQKNVELVHHQQAKSTSSVVVPNSATRAISKAVKIQGASSAETHTKLSGVIAKDSKRPVSSDGGNTRSAPTAKVSKQAKLTSPQLVHNRASGAIPKAVKAQVASSTEPASKIPARVITKDRKVKSKYCQTEDFLTCEPIKVSTTASQTVHLVNKQDAQGLLWSGIKKGDSVKIERAVLSGADIEEMREDKMTPLTLASEKGQVGVVRALLTLGARLEGRDGDALATPLHWACVKGHEPVVRELLMAGAIVDTKNYIRETPLSVASGWGHLAIVRVLVESGADLNAKDLNGRTPLAWSELRGKTSVAEYLRSVGATT